MRTRGSLTVTFSYRVGAVIFDLVVLRALSYIIMSKMSPYERAAE